MKRSQRKRKNMVESDSVNVKELELFLQNNCKNLKDSLFISLDSTDEYVTIIDTEKKISSLITFKKEAIVTVKFIATVKQEAQLEINELNAIFTQIAQGRTIQIYFETSNRELATLFSALNFELLLSSLVLLILQIFSNKPLTLSLCIVLF